MLLEPLMSLEAVVPAEYMGDVIGDINARRGKVEGIEERSVYKVIRALIVRMATDNSSWGCGRAIRLVARARG